MVSNKPDPILVVAVASAQCLLVVAFCSVLDIVTGFFDLLSDLVYRLVDCVAGFLRRTFLLLAAR